eukprot:300588_1
MANINVQFRIEDMRRELDNIRSLVKNKISSSEIRIVLRPAQLIHNHSVKDHGYRPIELEMLSQSPYVMDIALRLERHHYVDADKFVEQGKVNYKKYMKEMKRITAIMYKTARVLKLKALNKKNIQNELKHAQDTPIIKGDFVALRMHQATKINQNDKYGWIVVNMRLNRQGKRLFDLRNQYTGEKRWNITKSHIERKFTPIRDGKTLMRNEMTRLTDLTLKESLAKED